MALRPFKIPIKLLQLLGVWQDESGSTLYKLFGFILHFYTLEHGTFCQTVLSVNTLIEGNFIEFTESLSIGLTAYLTIFKSLIFLTSLKNIKQLMEDLEKLLKLSDFDCAQKRPHVKFYESSVIKISNLTYGFHLAICNLSLIMAIVFIEDKRLAFKTWFYFDHLKSDTVHAFLLMAEYVVSHYIILVNTSLDYFPVIFMCYILAILKELKERIERVHENMKSSEVDLKKCVDLHIRVEEFCQKISHNYAMHFMVQGIFSALILCTSTFLLSRVSIAEDSGLFFRTLLYVIVMIIQIFLPCYYGNEISFASQELSQKLFHSQWIDGSKEYKKSLSFMLEVMKKPIRINAYALLKINYETFTSVLNGAYSMYALLDRVSKE